MTSAAALEIRAAAERSGAAGLALRVAAKATGDGVAFGMGFDEPAPDDQVAVFEGLTVLIGEPSRAWLEGTVLDFVEEDGERQFVFVQPEPAAGGCASQRGCGSGGCGSCGG